MKSNNGKLTVSILAACIMTIWAVTMASADDHKGKAIEGKYSSTAVCINVSSPNKPNEKLVFATPPVFTNIVTGQTIWTFKRDGTGNVQGTQTGFGIGTPMAASVADLSFDFTYEIGDDWAITTDIAPGTEVLAVYTAGQFKGCTLTTDKFPQAGMVSKDHKTITLGSVAADLTTSKFQCDSMDPITLYGISYCGRVFTRIDE